MRRFHAHRSRDDVGENPLSVYLRFRDSSPFSQSPRAIHATRHADCHPLVQRPESCVIGLATLPRSRALRLRRAHSSARDPRPRSHTRARTHGRPLRRRVRGPRRPPRGVPRERPRAVPRENARGAARRARARDARARRRRPRGAGGRGRGFPGGGPRRAFHRDPASPRPVPAPTAASAPLAPARDVTPPSSSRRTFEGARAPRVSHPVLLARSTPGPSRTTTLA